MTAKTTDKKYNKVLGDLEALIMEAIWDEGEATVRLVRDKIRRAKRPAYTTVMTVMDRLHKKGLLKREKNDRDAYVYRPAQDRRDFMAGVSRKIISGLISEFGEDIAVAQFLDVLKKSDLKKSKEWKKRLKGII